MTVATHNGIATAALSLVGTPWRHQGTSACQGLDCRGLVVLACRRAGFDVENFLRYPTRPSPNVLLAHLRRECDQIQAFELGCICAVAYKSGKPRHLVINAGDRFVHATARRGVIDVAWTDAAREKVHSLWRKR